MLDPPIFERHSLNYYQRKAGLGKAAQIVTNIICLEAGRFGTVRRAYASICLLILGIRCGVGLNLSMYTRFISR